LQIGIKCVIVLRGC